MPSQTPLLEVKELKTYFHNDDGLVKAVDGVDFSIDEEQVLGVVGESGCGKSVTARSIMQLVPRPHGKIEGGKILFKQKLNGKKEIIDITTLPPLGRKMRSIRGNDIAMIFQDPMTSLNPVYTVGDQIVEAIKLHQKVSTSEARDRAVDILSKVRLPHPAQILNEYPHELSGGMRQRAMIAMALSCNPRLLIADEPTTALDVTIQAKILDLMLSLQSEFDMAIMMITHDLGVIAEICHQVVVMYMGKVVEHSDVRSVFHQSKHPYTKGLLKSIPTVGKKRINPIEGVVPEPYDLPDGCSFAPRCPQAKPVCLENNPPFVEVTDNHKVRCWLYD